MLLVKLFPIFICFPWEYYLNRSKTYTCFNLVIIGNYMLEVITGDEMLFLKITMLLGEWKP